MEGLSTSDTARCERARLARDARFDGLFYTAVKTTGIYCRPVCPAPAPKGKASSASPAPAPAPAPAVTPAKEAMPKPVAEVEPKAAPAANASDAELEALVIPAARTQGPGEIAAPAEVAEIVPEKAPAEALPAEAAAVVEGATEPATAKSPSKTPSKRSDPVKAATETTAPAEAKDPVPVAVAQPVVVQVAQCLKLTPPARPTVGSDAVFKAALCTGACWLPARRAAAVAPREVLG